MKKVLTIFFVLLMLILVMILQIYIFNELSFFGVKANFILVSVILVAIVSKINVSIPYTVSIGLLTDFIFSFSIGKNLIAYSLVWLLVSLILRKYNKENMWSSFLCFILGTVSFQLIFLIYNFIQLGSLVNVFEFIMMTLKLIIINTILGFVLYKLALRVNNLLDR